MNARPTIPNLITAARIGMAAAAAVLAVAGLPVAAVSILIAAAVLDAVDGWYARAFAQCSAFGAHMDPFADKILMGVVFVWLGVEAGTPWVWALVALSAAREIAVTLLRAFSLRRRGRFIPASRSGKYKMLTQSIVGLTLLSVMHFLGRDVPAAVVAVALLPALAASYVSGFGYVRRWRVDEARMRTYVTEGRDGEVREPRASAGR